MFCFTVVVFTSFSDLYRGADVLSKELPNSHKPPLTGMSWIQALLTILLLLFLQYSSHTVNSFADDRWTTLHVNAQWCQKGVQ